MGHKKDQQESKNIKQDKKKTREMEKQLQLTSKTIVKSAKANLEAFNQHMRKLMEEEKRMSKTPKAPEGHLLQPISPRISKGKKLKSLFKPSGSATIESQSKGQKISNCPESSHRLVKFKSSNHMLETYAQPIETDSQHSFERQLKKAEHEMVSFDNTINNVISGMQTSTVAKLASAND